MMMTMSIVFSFAAVFHVMLAYIQPKTASKEPTLRQLQQQVQQQRQRGEREKRDVLHVCDVLGVHRVLDVGRSTWRRMKDSFDVPEIRRRLPFNFYLNDLRVHLLTPLALFVGLHEAFMAREFVQVSLI